MGREKDRGREKEREKERGKKKEREKETKKKIEKYLSFPLQDL